MSSDELMSSSDDDNDLCREAYVDPPECEELSRGRWISESVQLFNIEGAVVGEGRCHTVDPEFKLGDSDPIGTDHVVVYLCRFHSQEHISDEDIYSLRCWPTHLVHCQGASLRDHEARHNFNIHLNSMQNPSSASSSRQYSSTVRNPPRLVGLKLKQLLTQESINSCSSKICCRKNCIQSFAREKIKAFRARMYRESTFKFRTFMKANVHRQVHEDKDGNKVVTLKSTEVCVRAWMIIAGVSETTFYRYQSYAREGRQQVAHGNTGLVKTRNHTLQSTATLRNILESTADHMPHRTRTLKTGEKVVSRVLPATFTWKGVILQINATNAAFGLNKLSTSSLSKIRTKKFLEFDVKRPGDNFARCSTCDKINSLIRSSIPGSEQALKCTKKRDKHLAIARAHRELYYGNRYHSMISPNDILTVIHDKMDHAKTASPVFLHKSKDLDGLMKLPVSVTGMIAHGHGDVRYAHYGLDVFSHDSNYTIGSMAKLLRDLELPPKYSSQELFLGSKSTILFAAVLDGAERCKESLPTQPQNLVEALPLPPILQMHMDNATGDNKNRYVFCFWSLLVAKKVFREVIVNFMIVGHTHDDIDALFGRWSMLLKKDSYPTVPALMKSFMDVEAVPVIPHLVEEVPDFKSFITGKFQDGEDLLIGHTKPQQFKFYLDSSGCPVMKYKLYCTDSEWLGQDGMGIKLWKEDAEGRSLWPRGVPQAVSQQQMKGVEDISKGLFGFQKYWENMCNDDNSGEYRRRNEHLVHYWRRIRVALSEPTPVCTVLRDGFWSRSRITQNPTDQIADDGDDLEEFGEDEAYVGSLRGRLLPSFRVGRDVQAGYFLAIRPSEGDNRPMWIAKALSNPNSNPDEPKCLLLQYYCPTSKDLFIQESYRGWDAPTGLRWKVDESEPPRWEETSTLMTARKPRAKQDTLECTIKIPIAQIQVIFHVVL